MKSIEIVKFLEKTEKAVFTRNDMAKIIKKHENYSSLVLHRLKEKGLVMEIERNRYTVADTHPFVIASNIAYPSYISFLTALSYYNLTTQIPKQLQVACLKSKKGIAFGGYSVKFIKFRPKRFFGYRREKLSYGFVFVAEPEKAAVDSLFLPRYCPVDETYNALAESKEKMDIEKLVEYALKMKSIVVLKRLGYLLDKNGIDIYKKLENKLNDKYDLLDTISGKGQKDKKWKLIINRKLD